MKLKKFPDFEPLDLKHKDVLKKIADGFPSYSDFNFVSLFSWDTKGSIAVSVCNENLIIKFTDYIDNSEFYSLLGTNRLEETIEILIKQAKKSGIRTDLSLVPESVVKKLKKANFSDGLVINEDPDNHDYIISVGELVEFKTNRFRGKKNLLNRFSRQYGEGSESLELDLRDVKTQKEIIQLLSDWQSSRNRQDHEVHNEFQAIRRSLDNHHYLEIKGFGVRYNDKLIAFTLFEVLKNKVAIIHFDKANVHFEGIFEHLKHNFAKHLAQMNIELINYEQDLGIEGLRRAKQSYHPVNYLKKYTISLANKK
ncbi:MAG: phosphatidylglycerol lysyltransferase domain-containing protein [Patescibacteria group bacterium]